MASCGFAPYNICKVPKKALLRDWGGDGGIMNVSDLNEGIVTVSTLFPSEGRLKIHMASESDRVLNCFRKKAGRMGKVLKFQLWK